MKRKAIFTICIAFILGVIAGCDKKTEDIKTSDRETINQVSLLQGLTLGDYNGSVSGKRIKELGDTGIGTFDGLNGELIMLDGIIYRAAGDGKIETVEDSETIPFCNVTFFDNDESQSISDIKDITDLKEKLDTKVNSLGKNKFYMIRIEGTFEEINVRSELAQNKPYEPLAKVLETDQTFFDHHSIKGTVVGLYCPPYMDRLNATGWHFHFISDDRKNGGHMLDLKCETAEVKWDYTDSFSMVLPDNEMFNGFDLTVDQSEDIKKVETGEEEHQKGEEEHQTGTNDDDLNTDIDPGFYKIYFMEMGYDRETTEKYLKVFESHGIYSMVIEVLGNGKAVINSDSKKMNFTYNDKYFMEEESDTKIIYIFKNNELTLYFTSALNSSEIDFKKMTPEEIEIMNKGYTQEELELAQKEAEEIFMSGNQVDDDSFMSTIEKTRRSTDQVNYSDLSNACQIVVFDKEMEKFLAEGHSYRLLITKEEVRIFVDGSEAAEDDIFRTKLIKQVGDLDYYKKKATVSANYIIDVNSDGTVVEISKPE